MKWIIYILFLALSFQVNAVSMENELFSLQADEIRFKLGELTAKRQVTIRLKSPLMIKLLMDSIKTNQSTSPQNYRMMEIDLSNGWILQGRINSIVVEKGVAVLEADELFLQSRQLLVKEM